MPERGARRAHYWHDVSSSGLITYVGSSGGPGQEGRGGLLWRGRVELEEAGEGGSAAFEVDARIRVAKRHSCVETLGGSKGRERKRSGECPTSRDDPATGSPATFCRRMLPFLTSNTTCAIWPPVRFGGHTLGIQKFRRTIPCYVSTEAVAQAGKGVGAPSVAACPFSPLIRDPVGAL